MAVEIPVIIDIDKAFEDAAKRVGDAMKPMQDYVDKNALGLRLKIDQNSTKTLSSILKDSSLSASQLDNALADVEGKIQRIASSKHGFDMVKGLTDKEKALLETYTILQRKITGIGNTSTLTQKLITINIDRVKKELDSLSAKLKNADKGSTKFKNLNDKIAQARVNLSNLNAELGRVRANESFDGLENSLTRSNSKLVTLIKNSVRLIALHTAGRFIRNVREVTAEFELQRVALGSIIQDTERAEGLFRQIKAAAIESPFEIKDLVSYTKQLSAYQIETDKLFDTTMKLADVSAGLGVDMSRLVLAYGQVRAAAVLRGQELRQFTEAGIPLVDKLAEKFTDLRGEMVSTGDVFQLISERAVPFRMIEEIFDEMTSAGGMFYKMQEKQAETLAGQWANLKDAVSIMYDEIGNTSVVHNAMESMISGAKSVMQNWRSWYNVISIVGTGLLAYYGIAKSIASVTELMAVAETRAAAAESARERGIRRFVTSLVGKTTAEKISTVATNLHTAAMNRASAAGNVFSATLWRLTAALLSNPFGVVIAAVGTLIALFTTLGKKTHDISEDIDNAESSISSFNKTTGETARLIDEYEELSKKEKLTSDEAKKLRDVSRELGEMFPKTTEGINQQTGALTLNIEKLKEYNSEAEKAIRKGMEAQIRENEETIRKNQKEINRLTRQNTRGWGRNKSLGLLSPILFPLSDSKMAENTAALIKLQDDSKKLADTNKKLEDTLNGVTESTTEASKQTTQWQEKLIEFNSRISKDGTTTISVLSPDQIQNYSSLSDALEDIAKKYKEYNEQEKAALSAIKGKQGAERDELQGILDRTKARKKLAKEELDYYNAFYLTQKSSGKDDHIQRLRNEINDITNAYKKFIELRKYKSEVAAVSDIGEFFPGLKGWTPTYENMLKKLEGMLANYKGDADATAILEQAIANIKFDEVKRSLDEQLKRLSDEIKRSETARNFYKNILDLTGDEDLAATLGVSVYGDIGKDFKDRIQRQLEAAFYDLDFSALDDQTFSDLSMAVSTQDFATVLEYIHVFPEEWQKVLREMAADSQKYNADQISNLLKELQSAKSYGEKRVQLARETAQRIAEINQISGITSEEREALLARNAKKEAQEVAKLQYEAFKESPMYVELFANLDNASTQMLRNMRDEILRLNESWKDLDPVQLKEMQSRIKELDEQLARRNPIKALTDAFKEYKAIRETYGDRSDVDKKAMDALEEQVNKEKVLEEAIKRVAAAEEHYRAVVANKGADSEEAKQAEGLVKSAKATMRARQSAAEAAREAADAAAAEQKKYADIIGDISEGVQGLTEWQDRIDKIADATRDLMETFGANDVDVQFFDDMVQGFSDVLGGATSAATGVAQLMAGDVVGGSMNLISGVAKAAKGVSNLIFAPKVHAANKEIEHQAELLSDLEYSYERVSKAMDKAFGNDRIYLMNQKIEQQEAKIAAYQAQLDAENSKGKKKSQDAIEGYENSIRNAKDELQDLKDSVSEYWAGQDLASAAEAFADSWLKAYQEFGSTSDAIKEKMQDMVEGLVKRAALAGVVQAVLKPWYDELGKIESWDAGTVSDMINKAFSMVPMINDGLSVAAGELTAAGVSLRSQVGGFTGISRSIASASEESILALTAGINTQNFYMSYTPLIYDQVAAIAAAMTGGVDPKLSTAGAEAPDMTQQYLSVLPSIDQNVADIKSMLKSVVSPNNTKSATHYVAVK